eukprot:8971218-Pyramimonas_sp.AAC.1
MSHLLAHLLVRDRGVRLDPVQVVGDGLRIGGPDALALLANSPPAVPATGVGEALQGRPILARSASRARPLRSLCEA